VLVTFCLLCLWLELGLNQIVLLMKVELNINGLCKTYSNGVKALDNFTLKIQPGIFGLLGPNGAGKSSLMRTIAALQDADEGTITFGEIDVLKQKNKVRKILGYLPQTFGLYPKIKAKSLLNHFAVLKGIVDKSEREDIVNELLLHTNLYDVRNSKLHTFSGGMKQRFGIAQALLANPKLIIVDEPTAGLDPAERNRFHNLLCEIGDDSVVILSTHIVDDIKELCSNMAIVNRGRVLLQGDPNQLIAGLKNNVYSKVVAKNKLASYRKEYCVLSEKLLRGNHVIHVYSESTLSDEFKSVSADLSDVYFNQIRKSNIY